MDEFPPPEPRRVDSFIVGVAAKLRVAQPISHEEAVSEAIMLLRDRLHRDFGPSDVLRLAGQMRVEALSECEAVLMRARFGLPSDRCKREVRIDGKA